MEMRLCPMPIGGIKKVFKKKSFSCFKLIIEKSMHTLITRLKVYSQVSEWIQPTPIAHKVKNNIKYALTSSFCGSSCVAAFIE